MVEYVMPVPHIGEIVLWYEGGVRNEQRACPAMVIKTDQASVMIKAFGIDRDFRIECVRHMSDPNARESERLSDGGWDFVAPKQETNAFIKELASKER